MSGPVMVTTWPFGLPACRAGWDILSAGGLALDAIEAAGNVTEEDPEVGSVGLGGMPNAEGVVELDAAIMDGRTHSAGAVGGMSGIRRPISVARQVMETTPHVMLVGANARRFAIQNCFAEHDLLTDKSRAAYREWRDRRSAPDVAHFREQEERPLAPEDHDTIGLCALDANGDLAAGCTTSGLSWKLPGRVGDSPIIGSGLYLDNEVGAAAATGDGDEMMKVCLTYRVVLLMERGLSPQEACEEAIRYLMRKRPPEQHGNYGAAVIALSKGGAVGAAATKSGFRAPDRRWVWASASPAVEPQLHEGTYVTETTSLPTLPESA